MLRTSEPASGSVTARQMRFSPLRISGNIFDEREGEANFWRGGAPTTSPMNIDAIGPARISSSQRMKSWKPSQSAGFMPAAIG